MAVAKDCWRKYGAPAGKNLAKNVKGIMEICKNSFDPSGHPHAKTLPGEELNCFYLDVLEELCFEPKWLSWDVYCKEERRIRREWFGSPGKY